MPQSISVSPFGERTPAQSGQKTPFCIPALCLVLSALFMLAPTQATTAHSQPPVSSVMARQEMIVTAHPLATEAGAEMLRMGGNAVDAMVAALTVLSLVEPQSSGLGGGAFVVYYDATSGKTTTLDGRETAPAAATEQRFAAVAGFADAWQSGLSVGVPGVVRLMADAHRQYGRLPWQELFDPALSLARDGYPLSGRTSSQVQQLLDNNDSCDDDKRLYLRDPVAFAYFVGQGSCRAKPAGSLMFSPAYHNTLLALQRQGADAFYRGELAQAIVAAVSADKNRPGDMTLSDLKNYRVIQREPLCFDYLARQVCSMRPPSSALSLAQILGLVARRPELMGSDPLAPSTVHLFTQAGRLAFADRAKYIADGDFVTVPLDGLLDDSYLSQRAALIGERDMGTAAAGKPDFPPPSAGSALRSETLGADKRVKNSGTSHLSIIDRYGNALSMTASIESSLGNGVMVGGFMLNNQLTDFSFAWQDEAGNPVANRVEPGKRPRSSMTPAIVFDSQGRVELITGSPGGSRIIGYTARSIISLLHFGLSPQQAVAVPHVMSRNGETTDIEPPQAGITLHYDADQLIQALEARGHRITVTEQSSGLSVIQVKYPDEGKVLFGGADRRRDGTAGGR